MSRKGEQQDTAPAKEAPAETITAQPSLQPVPAQEFAAALITEEAAPKMPDMAAIDALRSIGAPFTLRKDRATGKVTEPEPAQNTIKWWGLQERLPHWLVEAMGVQRYPNQELTRVEALNLALETANLPLGPRKGKA